MDWKKVKTQLIIILLILNIILFFNYVNGYLDQRPYQISSKSKNILQEQLESSGIVFSAELPSAPKELGSLIVKYQEKYPDEINEKFFKNKGVIEHESDLTKLYYKKEEVTIINNRRLLYENLNPSTTSPNLDSEELVKNFLIDKGFFLGDMLLTKKKVQGEEVYLEYTKIFEGNMVETSYTRFKLKDGVIRLMDRLWVDVIEKDDRVVEIEPAYKSVLSLIGNEQYDNNEVIDVSLCYYFNPEAQGVLEDNTKAVRGRTVPAWRIAFKSGDVEIVDNY